MARTIPELEGTETELTTEPSIEPHGELITGWTPSGRLGSPTIRDRPEEPALTTPLHYWEGSDGSKVGIAQSRDYADEGYPWVVLKSYTTAEGTTCWTLTHIAEDKSSAIKSAARVADHREYLRQSGLTETYFEWVSRSGGTAASIAPPAR